jgi:hypothetical protein
MKLVDMLGLDSSARNGVRVRVSPSAPNCINIALHGDVMRAIEFLESSYQNVWYHGSSKNFNKFDLSAVRANRGTNVSGIYLTKDEYLAREYASKDGSGQGYVYEVQHDSHRSFTENKDKFTDEMLDEYVKLLAQHTNYSEEWARNSLVPEVQKTGKLKADLDGDIKRQVYEAGGYDSYWFNDMGDMVLVVFDPSDITILNKFEPQQLVKDKELDNHAKEPKEPNQINNKQEDDPFEWFDNFLKN